MPKALVVLSGGQDSTTCLFWAIHKFGKDNVHAITFDYGQRHSIELTAAAKVATLAGIAEYVDVGEAGGDIIGRWEKIVVDGLLQSTSPLTSENDLRQYESFESMEAEVGNKIENTFVPLRNTLFAVIAANRAVALGCQYIVLGICQADNANYPDCTDQFRVALDHAINCSLGTAHGANRLIIEAPLIFKSKAQSVKLAATLPGCMDALAYSHTSYDGKYPPTDNNHANLLRAKGFEEAKMPDPLVVRAWHEGLMELPETSNYDAFRNGV